MGTKIKSPVTKGVARVPVVLQLEALECGAASLAMVAAYYGKWVTCGSMRTQRKYGLYQRSGQWKRKDHHAGV